MAGWCGHHLSRRLGRRPDAAARPAGKALAEGSDKALTAAGLVVMGPKTPDMAGPARRDDAASAAAQDDERQDVSKPELGTKRIDPETGRKFYDLNKDPIVSPYTGKSYPRSYFESGAAAIAEDEDEIEEKELDGEDDVETVSLEEADEEAAGGGGEDDIEIEDEEDVDLGDDEDETFLEEEEEDDDVSGMIDVDDDEDEH
jgi:uncharacterized protein (TIGR02300 family)